MNPRLEAVDFGIAPEALFAAVHARRGAFFLDSGLPAGGLGSWSFIGFDPFLIFRSKGGAITLDEGGRAESHAGDPLAELQALLRRFHHPAGPARSGAPGTPPFLGGAVGFYSYELCPQLERVPRTPPDDPGIPDIEFGFYDGILAFERASGKAFIVAHPVHGESAETIVERIRKTLREALASRPDPRHHTLQPAIPTGSLQSNFTRDEYLRAVARVRDYIAAGDVYQVNLSQRYEGPLPRPPFEIFQRLRRHSPAPFAAYLHCGDLKVISSSPECFLRIRGDRVETHPIKGTRPRGKSPEEDERLKRELLGSAKDRAELLMIVDLERNDLGRVCETGSVMVEDLFRLESHPTVHHLVATVSGKLPADRDVVDCIRAMFPGGSITGAPKIRAMQIIDELENRRRHLYTGAIGYLGFDGNCDLNIAIRTLVASGGRISYGVGGGIVWDSDPATEYQETLDKGRAMRAALETGD